MVMKTWSNVGGTMGEVFVVRFEIMSANAFSFYYAIKIISKSFDIMISKYVWLLLLT